MNILKKSSQRFSSFRNLIGLIISFGCIYWSFANFNFDEFINYYNPFIKQKLLENNFDCSDIPDNKRQPPVV